MKMKLSAKIMSTAGMTLGLLMTVMAVYQYALTSTVGRFKALMATEIELKNHAGSIKELLSFVVANEKTYIFLKDKKYAVSVEEGMEQMLKEADSIELLAGRSGDDVTRQQAGAVKNHTNEYRKSFQGVVSAMEAKGLDAASGLQGEFSAIAQRLGNDMQGYQVEDLYLSLLQMRRYEKDYIASESDKDKRYLLESVEKYRELLGKSESEGESLKVQKDTLVEYTEILKQYISVTEGKEQSASPKTVLYRSLKMRATKMEDALARVFVPRATELLLNIRINEKEYSLFHDNTYVETTRNAIVQLNESIQKAGILEKHVLAAQKALADYRSTFNALVEKDNEIGVLLTTMGDVAGKIQQLVEEIAKNAEATVTAKTGTTVSSANAFALIAIGVGIAAIFIGTLLSFFITRSITRPINEVIEGLDESAEQVTAASGEISSSSQQLADGTSQQAAAIEETSSSLEEISAMTRQNAESASHANQLAKDVHRIVIRANESMTTLNTSMAQISSQSAETRKIIRTIDEIAFQTNLLALNAAVEAARAGEAGAGFAVVADEVRNLALRAAEAAKNTANLIDGIVKKIKEGFELMARAHLEFQEVKRSVEKTGELVGEIAVASQEQAEGIAQINKATAEMDKITQQNASNAEESAAGSEEMNAQAYHLREFVTRLTVLVHGKSGEEPQRRKARPSQEDEEEILTAPPLPQSRVLVKQMSNGNIKQTSTLCSNRPAVGKRHTLSIPGRKAIEG